MYVVVSVEWHDSNLPLVSKRLLNTRLKGAFTRRRCSSVRLFVDGVTPSIQISIVRLSRRTRPPWPPLRRYGTDTERPPSPVSHVSSSREIYASGGGLVVASINAPDLFPFMPRKATYNVAADIIAIAEGTQTGHHPSSQAKTSQAKPDFGSQLTATAAVA